MIIPECFKDFKCKNKACTDNCCIGWEIDIDKDTENFYKGYKGKLEDKLKASISKTSVCHFIMGKDGRCPFLNSDNLCEIILELGEEKTPYICRNHPRFYEWLYDRTECGIGLACEEGARLLFEKEDKFRVEFRYELTDDISDILTFARDTAFNILQKRELSLRERLMIFLEFSYDLDELLFEGRENEITALCDKYKNEKYVYNEEKITAEELKNFILIFKSLEPIDLLWEKYITDLYKKSEEILIKKEEFFNLYKSETYKYEHLAVYFVYRYFLKAIEDRDVLTKSKLSVISVIFNIIMDISDTVSDKKPDRINNSKLYSKEVEYSEENLNYIFDQTYEDDLLSFDGLLRLISILNM